MKSRWERVTESKVLPHSAFFFSLYHPFFSFSLDLWPRAEKAKRSSPARTTSPARPSSSPSFLAIQESRHSFPTSHKSLQETVTWRISPPLLLRLTIHRCVRAESNGTSSQFPRRTTSLRTLPFERLVKNCLPITGTASHNAIKSKSKGKGTARATEAEDDQECIVRCMNQGFLIFQNLWQLCAHSDMNATYGLPSLFP